MGDGTGVARRSGAGGPSERASLAQRERRWKDRKFGRPGARGRGAAGAGVLLWHGVDVGCEADVVGSTLKLSREAIERSVPALRRFARALVRHHRVETADELVQETIVCVLRADGAAPTTTRRLYATLVRVHRAQIRTSADRRETADRGVAALDRRPAVDVAPATALSAMPLELREALLLVSLESFGYDDAADILGVSREVLVDRLARARATLGADLGAPIEPVRLRGRDGRRAGHLRLVK